MYEMEGAFPGHAAPGQPVAWPPRPCGPPAGDVYPRQMPVSRSLPRPLSFLRSGTRFPTVRVFLLPRQASRKGLRQSHGEFFAIHTVSTERRRLSAVYEGYPLVYAQHFHSLPVVTRGILAYEFRT